MIIITRIASLLAAFKAWIKVKLSTGTIGKKVSAASVVAAYKNGGIHHEQGVISGAMTLNVVLKTAPNFLIAALLQGLFR